MVKTETPDSECGGNVIIKFSKLRCMFHGLFRSVESLLLKVILMMC